MVVQLTILRFSLFDFSVDNGSLALLALDLLEPLIGLGPLFDKQSGFHAELSKNICVHSIGNKFGKLIEWRSIKMFLLWSKRILDCFCFLRDETSFISRRRFSFQLNVLYGWFYWINSTVRLETRPENRFENVTSYKRQKMKWIYSSTKFYIR